MSLKSSGHAIRLSAIGLMMLPLSAGAGIVYTNGDYSATSAPWESNTSSPAGSLQVAQTFTLSSDAVITDVHWSGAVTPSDELGAADPSQFTLQFFENPLGASPGASTLLREITTSSFTSLATGDQYLDLFPLYDYSVQIADLALSAGTYTLSIFESSGTVASPTSYWNWATTGIAGVNPVFSYIATDSDWAPAQENRPVAFSLTDDYAVPEPATVTMLGLGLAGIAYRRRKNKAGREST